MTNFSAIQLKFELKFGNSITIPFRVISSDYMGQILDDIHYHCNRAWITILTAVRSKRDK